MLRLLNLLYPHGKEGFFIIGRFYGKNVAEIKGRDVLKLNSTFNLIQGGQQGGVILWA
jgi:hypothetical protein